MIFLANKILSIYSIIILFIFLYFICRHKYQKTVEQNLLKYLVIGAITMLLVDVISRLDGLKYDFFPILNHAGNYLLFALAPILPIIWTLYISYKVNLSIKSTKKLAIKLIILFVINLVFVSIMIVSGLFYTINASNIYARGPLFALSYIMPIGLLLYSFYFIFTNQKRIDGSHLYALMFFAIPPIIAAIAQGFVYGFSLIYNSITISILLIFIKNQANQMDVDYLTNVYNRKKLQNHLTERINNTTRDGEFAAMMIDLDGFKVINDTYGHTEGDQALRIVADLIKKAVGKQVLVARYGGDEFCLVLDVKQATDIAKINDCINRQFNAFNALNIKPYQLSFSMGYEVFNKSKHKNVDVFIDVLDKFMYKDKGKKKTTQ